MTTKPPKTDRIVVNKFKPAKYNIAAWRARLNLTPSQAGDLLGYSTDQVTKWELDNEPMRACVKYACKYIELQRQLKALLTVLINEE